MADSRANAEESSNAHIRPAIRSATFIIPRTGERVRRVVTLRAHSDTRAAMNTQPERPTQASNDSDTQAAGADNTTDSRTPLLGRSSASSRSKPSQLLNRLSRFKEQARKQLENWNRFWKSRIGQGILKCTVAYTLGSLGTFLPFLSNWLGHQDGKHMMATVTVYFHPARSQGNMFEALFCAFIAFLYAAFISITSMGVTVLFDDVLQRIILGHIIVLVVFCGGGLGLVGWTKQRLSNPLVNVGCSLTSLAIITVLTKEGSIQAGEFSLTKVVQVLKMVVIGCLSSTVVCFAIFPVSARGDLKQGLIEVTDSLGDTLSATASAFLHGWEDEIESKQHQNLSATMASRSAAMQKLLKEAKWEHYIYGTEKQYKLQSDLVHCIQRLLGDVGGLRAAARSQFSLLAQTTSSYNDTKSRLSKQNSFNFGLASPENIAESPRDGLIGSSFASLIHNTEPQTASGPHSRQDSFNDLSLPVSSPRAIFDRFIDQLGPSIRSLAYTLRQILDDLPYGPGPEFPITLQPQLRSSLDQAIELYSQARKDALVYLYQSRDMQVSQPRAVAADFEEVAASCGYFSYSLQDFAEELRTYLSIIDELQAYEENGLPRSWSWLHAWSFLRKRRTQGRENEIRENDSDEPIYIVTSRDAIHSDDPVDINIKTKPHHWKSPTPLQSSWRRIFWNWAHVARREDVKFAVKVGFGAAIYALPSFIPSSRPFFMQFRGEWGLLSYMLVCSMTIGSANTTGFARGWGTCVGAISALLAWLISGGNAFVLIAFGWIMSATTSYITIARGNGPLGRFIMLSYNLSCLYAYSLSVKDDDHDDDEGGTDPDIYEIAFHRVVAVLTGCIWGIIITRLIWPISARRKFHDGLGVLLLRMSLIWRRDPLDGLTEDGNGVAHRPHPYMDLAEELQLQHYLAQLSALSRSAAAEYELRGPFPERDFARILSSVGRMLEAFHSMNVIITKDLRASPGEAAILRATHNERAYLSRRISHLFQVLASSLRLQFPLDDALPSTENARDRLLARVFSFRRLGLPADQHNLSLEASQTGTETVADSGTVAGATAVLDADYALLYAYSLVTMLLAKEIKLVGEELGKMYGILDEDRLKLK